MLDHGFEVDSNTRCIARTVKERQCSMQALKGIDRCALHAGLATAKANPGFGDPKVLEAYRRSAGRRASQPGRPRG
jgi:hypothetical protein